MWFDLVDEDNHDIAIVSYGPIIDRIAEEIKDVNIYNAIYQKPIAPDLIKVLLKHQAIIIHDAYATSVGFANLMLNQLNEANYKGIIKILAIPDIFIKQATIKEQMEECGVDVISVKNLVNRLKTSLK